MTRPCGHCAATEGHTAGCPVPVSLLISVDQDRRWFLDHPGAARYRRPPCLAEIEALVADLPPLPPGFEIAGRVLVEQLEPGIRARSYAETYAVLGPVTE